VIIELPPLQGVVDIRGKSYDEIEEEVLRGALALAGGNRAVAAGSLGLPKNTLADKLRRMGL
jgi:DNA-binding NtrC family response regulator